MCMRAVDKPIHTPGEFCASDLDLGDAHILISVKISSRNGRVLHSRYPSTEEVEARGLRTPGLPGLQLHLKVPASLLTVLTDHNSFHRTSYMSQQIAGSGRVEPV